MPSLRRIITIVLVLGVLLTSRTNTQAQDARSRYFVETGHTVSGDFLDYYESVPDPLLLFGYPITEAFEDPLSHAWVQYFQRARFELHMDADPGERVQQSNLGTLLYQAGPEVLIPTDTPACRTFDKPGIFVCYSFLEFFDKNGGVEMFGQPISNIEWQDDLYVQYFEHARLEWHPELQPGERVTLANLGRIYFDQRGGDPDLLKPNPRGSGLADEVIQLQARAFVSKAVLAQNSQQEIFVIVQDQYLRPVVDATVAIQVTFPNGDEARYKLPLTNQFGFAQFTFPVGAQPANEVAEIEVEVAKGGVQESTSAWFRIWW